MRLLLLILVLVPVVVLSAAEEKKAAKPPAKARLTLPEGAQKIEAFTYRYKDSDGKVWIYRQTPFGLTRYEDEKSGGSTGRAASAPRASTAATSTASSSSASAQTSAADPTGITAIDEGENVRFEKVGPFGKYTWVRRKTELSAQEKQAWEQARKEKPAARKATKESTP